MNLVGAFIFAGLAIWSGALDQTRSRTSSSRTARRTRKASFGSHVLERGRDRLPARAGRVARRGVRHRDRAYRRDLVACVPGLARQLRPLHRERRSRSSRRCFDGALSMGESSSGSSRSSPATSRRRGDRRRDQLRPGARRGLAAPVSCGSCRGGAGSPGRARPASPPGRRRRTSASKRGARSVTACSMKSKSSTRLSAATVTMTRLMMIPIGPRVVDVGDLEPEEVEDDVHEIDEEDRPGRRDHAEPEVLGDLDEARWRRGRGEPRRRRWSA